MALNVLRGLFVLLMAAVGYSFIKLDPRDVGSLGGSTWLALAFSLSLGVLMVVLDIVSGRRKLAVFSGLAVGILVGLTITYALSFGVSLVVDNVIIPDGGDAEKTAIASFLNLMIGTTVCYFAISFVLQTKDDLRFVIPYIEFRRDTRGVKPVVVDTSALMDPRIEPVLESGFLDGRLIVPQSVVRELQNVADLEDRDKGLRGREGLDRLNRLQKEPEHDVRIYDDRPDSSADQTVDQRVIDLASNLEGRVLSLDVNLAKVARLAGLPVLNLNELSEAVRPPARPGDRLQLDITRRGTIAGQGVAHLPDGTMVVVEEAGDQVGETIDATVTNATQTGAGRMIFARTDRAGPRRRRKLARPSPKPEDADVVSAS
jgi:uncharacterized protein YacL